MSVIQPHLGAPPDVDVLVVSYNGQRWLTDLLDSLAQTRYPLNRLRLVVVDNQSQDGSVALLRDLAGRMPYLVEIVAAGRNLGFAGGYEIAFARLQAKYCLVLNQDTRVSPEAIGRLVAVLEAEPLAGLAEARQTPRELDKDFDPETRETSWSSGACMMVRTAALREVGGFDPALFMYWEDVDLSWRMWLRGWKCLYVREAVVEHWGPTESSHASPATQYHMLRNAIVLRTIYSRWREVLGHSAGLLRRVLFSRRSFGQRRLALRAFCGAIRLLPHGLKKRRQLYGLGPHPWVQFKFKNNDRLISQCKMQPIRADCLESSVLLHGPLEFERAAALQVKAREEGRLTEDVVNLSGHSKRAIVMQDHAMLEFTVAECPPGAILRGLIGLETSKGEKLPKGHFMVEQDDFVLWDARFRQQSRWQPIAVPLRPGRAPARLVLRFVSGKMSAPLKGCWSDLELRSPAPREVRLLG